MLWLFPFFDSIDFIYTYYYYALLLLVILYYYDLFLLIALLYIYSTRIQECASQAHPLTDRRTAAPAAAGPAGPAEDKDGVWHTVDARFTTKDGNAIYTVIMALNSYKWDYNSCN